MGAASGVFKQVRIKKQTAPGTLAGPADGQLLRHVTSGVELSKDTYRSSEKASHQQVADMRHGVRRVAGPVNCELSPGTYAEMLGSLLRRAFAAVTALSGLSITIAADGENYTLARATGSFITDGVKFGEVRRLTAGTFDVANLNKNLVVLDVTALVLKVKVLNGSALVAQGPITGATLALPGKKTFVPSSAHTDDCYTYEHFYADIGQSEVFTDVRVDTAAIELPATGMSMINFGLVGKDLITDDDEYFTTPTAETTTGVVAAVNGLLLIAGVPTAVCTGASLSIAASHSGRPVVGSNTIPHQRPGRLTVTGQFTAYFEDDTYRNAFVNETEMNAVFILTAGNEANADFISIVLPRIKAGGSGKDDGETEIIQTVPFEALRHKTGGIYDQTTIAIQDSAAA